MMLASPRSLIALCTLGLLVIAIPFLVHAEEDRAYISGSFSQYVEVNESYVGEGFLYLVISFGQGASDWRVVLESPLLEERASWAENRSIWAGETRDIPLHLNVSAPPGKYLLSPRLSYTNLDGMQVDKVFNITMDHVRAMELRRISIVHGSPDRLRVEVEVFRECSSLHVSLYEAPRLLLSIPQFNDFNLTPGVHTYESELTGFSGLIPQDEDWVRCQVYADFDRFQGQVVLPEVTVHIRTLEGYSSMDTWLRLAMISATIALIMIPFAFALRRRRKRRLIDGPKIGP
jgi:hypothetical protein